MKKTVLSVGLFALTAVIVSGCGTAASSGSNATGAASEKTSTTSSANANSNTSNASTTGTSKANVVDISFWYGISNTLSDDVQKMVKQFNASHPGIHVTATFQGSYSGGGPEQQKLLAAIKAGNPPDLAQIEVNSMPVFASTGKLMDLTNFMKNSSVDKPSNFIDGMLVSTQLHGKTYGVPLNRSVPVMFYNKTLFKKAGIANPPKTWDDLAVDAHKLTAGSGASKVYGYGPLVDWWPFESMVWSSGSQLMNSSLTKATFNTASADRVLQLQQDLVKNGDALVESGKNYWDLMTQDFIKGKVAIDIDSIGDAAEVQNGVKTKFDWGTAFMPSDKSLYVPPGGGDMAVMAGIPAKSAKASETFIEWWTSPKQAAEWAELTGYLPVVKGALNDSGYQKYLKQHPQFQTAISELKYQKAAPASPDFLKVMQVAMQGMQGVFDEKKPVAATMQSAQSQANSLIG